MEYASAVSANDSTASLDAGGVRLTYNPHISMESEHLYLSPEEVRVAYRFRNRSERTIDTLVAFPLPPILIGEEGNYDLQGRDHVNVMDFEVTVDGRDVRPSVEIRAIRFGVDVTDVLKRHDISPTMVAANDEARIALKNRLDNLPEEARAELERFGVADWDTTFESEGKALANTHWDAHVTYYWFQAFPAGASIEVTHRYKPVPGRFFFTKDEINSPETSKRYCMDQLFSNAAEKALDQSPRGLLAGTHLRYVVSTAGNWLGPIGKFHLTVEKPSEAALVSLCASGIKRTGLTTFELLADNYVPERDIDILFLEPLPDKPW